MGKREFPTLLLTKKAAAFIIGMSEKTLDRRIRSGDFPIIRDGRIIRVRSFRVQGDRSAHTGVDSLTRGQPKPDRCKLDEGKVAGGEFVVACRDPPALLDPVEEALRCIPGSVRQDQR